MPKNNWKLLTIRKKAETLGLEIKFVKEMFGPRHVQNRVYISGHRCQVATAPSSDTNGVKAIEVRELYSPWAQFLILVSQSVYENEKRFYVIPTQRLAESSFQKQV
jgi:hypothetical protein